MQHTPAQQQMINMFGQEYVDKLASLSQQRQRVIANNQPVELLYALVKHRMQLSSIETFVLFEGVDVYDRHFLVTEV